MKLINSFRAGTAWEPIPGYESISNNFASQDFLDLEALTSCSAGDLPLQCALALEHVHLVEMKLVLL